MTFALLSVYCEVVRMNDERKWHETDVGDFYESFEANLEDDEITAEEEGFMIGFVEVEE